MPKKVLVSGCFDLLHSGHITFLEQAAEYGDLYVCLGSDSNIELIKGHSPSFNQKERLHILQAIRVVKHARISSGTGLLDFENDLKDIQPDIFIVNSDSSLAEKKDLCEKK
jgi:cytidyltransferase-like protein